MLDFIKEKTNCWDSLSECTLPVFIYGMGDGALKILSVMASYKIPVAGFFASDEFVRGHSFEGHKIHTLSEIESSVDKFVIVLAFAAGYPELVEKVNALSRRHMFVAPDVPVAGEGLFTYEYCIENAEKIDKVYNLLSDQKSKEVFSGVINFKISGNISYLNEITTEKCEIYQDIIKPDFDEIYIDLGAYNGDTVIEFLKYTDNKYKKIIALEPDKKNYKKLVKAIGPFENIEAFNVAAWDSDTVLTFAHKAGRQSSLSQNGIEVTSRSVDSILEGNSCTIIKMDVEGSERRAILGSRSVIREFSPRLMISLYHRNEDLFELPLLIHEINPDYKLFIRHQLYIPAWETNLYATL